MELKFDTMADIEAVMQTLTDDQLSQMSVEAVTMYMSGEISDNQLQLVAAVVINELCRRMLEETAVPAGATVH